MLLLVMAAKLDQFTRRRRRGAFQKSRDARVNMLAIVIDLFQARTRDEATLWPGLAFADRIVIGIEEEIE